MLSTKWPTFSTLNLCVSNQASKVSRRTRILFPILTAGSGFTISWIHERSVRSETAAYFVSARRSSPSRWMPGLAVWSIPLNLAASFCLSVALLAYHRQVAQFVLARGAQCVGNLADSLCEAFRLFEPYVLSPQSLVFYQATI